MRLSSIHALILVLAAPLVTACGTTSFFKGPGSGYSIDPGRVQVIASKDDISADSYREVGTARAKAATAQQAVDMAKERCGRAGGGDLLIMNTPPFQSGERWNVDATCGLSAAAQKSPPPSSGGKPAGSSGSKGKPIR